MTYVLQNVLQYWELLITGFYRVSRPCPNLAAIIIFRLLHLSNIHVYHALQVIFTQNLITNKKKCVLRIQVQKLYKEK